MGNTPSSSFSQQEEDVWWTGNTQETASTSDFELGADYDRERLQHRKELQEDLNEFRQELAIKHEKRRELIRERRKEMADLRQELETHRLENLELKKLLSHEGKCTCQCPNPRNSRDNQTNIQGHQFDSGSPETDNSKVLKDLEEQTQILRSTMDEMRLELEKSAHIADKNNELRIGIADLQSQLQHLNSEVANFEEERQDYKTHVIALKDVIKVSKDLLKIRENQINELTNKIGEIEVLLKEREAELMADSLREEYEKQLNNIRHLRTLYEERQRANAREKETLNDQMEELRGNVESEAKNSKELQERINELEEDNSKKYDTITSLESNLGFSKAESRELQAEMAVINQLFSQILMSFKNCQEVDLDKLTKILAENHDLLTDIVVNEESNEVSSALPKTLLDLVNQVADQENQKAIEESQDLSEEGLSKLETILEESESQTSTVQLNSAEEIVENLPKVWRVLIELLSHQSAPTNVILEEVQDDDNPCYKSIQTPTGTKLVVSVSKTYIRLKDLILEKKSLEKEMGRLKHLNGHLESRLQDQEKRLETVSSELSKTWHVVGKMQRQHQQLHTQEKILRYELAQKRKLLTELKEELEYCREKWVQAREKNSSTEEQWKQLRTEFASRKNTVECDSNNSVESGYSDEKSSSDSDDHEDYEDKKENEGEADQNTAQTAETLAETDGTKEANSSILQVVQTEIANIEGILEEGSEVQIASGCAPDEEEKHSLLESNKTDLVQSNERQGGEAVDEERPAFKEIDVEKPEVSEEAQRKEETREAIEERQDTNEELQETNEGMQEMHEKRIGITEESVVINEETQEVQEVTGDINEKVQQITEIQEVSKSQEVIEETNNQRLETHEQSQETKEETLENRETCEDSQQTEETALQNQLHSTQESVGSLSHQESSTSKPQRTPEEILAGRDARLKRLEDQCQQLVTKVTNTSQRSIRICNKLEDLHGIYGEGSSGNGERRANSRRTETETESGSTEEIVPEETSLEEILPEETLSEDTLPEEALPKEETSQVDQPK